MTVFTPRFGMDASVMRLGVGAMPSRIWFAIAEARGL